MHWHARYPGMCGTLGGLPRPLCFVVFVFFGVISAVMVREFNYAAKKCLRQSDYCSIILFMTAILKAIFDSPLKHGVIPASGGLAARVVSISSKRTPAELNRAFVSRLEAKGDFYKGYQIQQTPSGEFFSTLDKDSWYETKMQCKRAIDSFLKGRAA